MHLRNSADLLEKFSNFDVTGKKMISFDVKSLFTNVSIDGAIRALKEVLDLTDDIELPVRKADYIRLVELCVNFGSFEFQGEEYVQVNGLAMGSPLSAVLANLYMELLEKEHYLSILGDNVNVYRYVDDMIAFIPNECDVDDLLGLLNDVELAIQPTVEKEREGKLPFLDMVIRRSLQGLKFSVYRKPTNKDDFVHYFSTHSRRTKSGIVIGFFLRAYRICSAEYLKDELEYITRTFRRLRFPEALIINLQAKARKIKEKADRRTRSERTTEENKDDKQTVLVVPHSRYADSVSKQMAPEVKMVTSAGKKLGQIVKRRNPRRPTQTALFIKFRAANVIRLILVKQGGVLKQESKSIGTTYVTIGRQRLLSCVPTRKDICRNGVMP